MTDEIEEGKLMEDTSPERSAALLKAIQTLVEEVHREFPFATDAPGNAETQRVVLNIPRGLVRLAGFLAVVDEDAENPLHFWDYVNETPDDSGAARKLARMQNHYLENIVSECLELDLHLLATGALRLRGQRSM